MLNISLTEEQEHHYESIKWLFSDGNCGQGRSYLLAVIWINKALDNPDEWISIIDHRPLTFKTGRRVMMDKIFGILANTDVKQGFEYQFQDFKFRFSQERWDNYRFKTGVKSDEA